MAHDTPTRENAIARLLAGESVQEVSRDLRLPESTVRSWSYQSADFRAKKTAEVEGRLIAYLESSLESLRSQVESVSDPEYVKKQPANEMAILHGVIADKAFRIIDSLAQSGTGS